VARTAAIRAGLSRDERRRRRWAEIPRKPAT
jgi:hypothetical protein